MASNKLKSYALKIVLKKESILQKNNEKISHKDILSKLFCVNLCGQLYSFLPRTRVGNGVTQKKFRFEMHVKR